MEQQFAGWRKKFFVIWTGQGISTLTSSIVQMAIIWYITGKTKSAAVLSFATLAGFLPQAVLGMFIGVLIDQYDRKKIMICSDLVMSSACVALAVSGIWGGHSDLADFYCIIHPKHWQCVLCPVPSGYYAVHLTKGPADKIRRLFTEL